MGIFLAPFLLGTLIGFSAFGLRFGFVVLRDARHRVAAAAALLAMGTFLASAAIVLPFVVGFLLGLLFVVGSIAALASICLWDWYRDTHRQVYGVSAAAFCLAAASVPVTWFWLSDRLGAWFGVSWSY